MADIIGEYREGKLAEEMRGNWAMAVLHRPPSFALVWLLARTRMSPDAVSWTGGAVALALPLAAGFAPLPQAGLAVFALAFLFQVLDCVDGGLARITRRTSASGAKLDGLIDVAQWGLLYGAIGLLADRQFGTGGVWSALALGAAWMRLFAKTVRPEMPGGGDGRPLTAVGVFIAFLTGLSGLIPFLALAGPWLGAAVWALVAYALLDLIDAAR